MTTFERPFRTTRRLSNLARPGWYRIKAQASGPTRVDIYDEIGFLAVSAQDFVKDLGSVDGDIELHLNSPGGDVFEGLAIYNSLKQRSGSVSVIVDGLAASAASFVAQAASPGCLSMAPHSQLMVHDAFGMGIGNAADMRTLADLLDKASDNISGIYADRTGQPADTWREAMRTETWYSDQEAVDAGLADNILGQESPQNAWDLSVFRNANNGWQQRDGKWVFDPDNDGDNDATASGDTDHDYWSADGKQLKSIPPDPDGKQGKPLPPSNESEYDLSGIGSWVIEDQTGDVDNSPWDASKAWAAGANADNPAAFYNGICAGKKAGDPSTQAAHALPYKYSPSSAPNAAGVRNALARIDQTQGLTNKAQAQALLERLMKQINPDYDSSDEFNRELFRDALRKAFE